jgi:hypothetical protein
VRVVVDENMSSHRLAIRLQAAGHDGPALAVEQTMSTDMPRRRWLAISLKGLILLVLILGLILGWQVHRAREQRRATQVIRDSGGSLHYDWEFVGGTFVPGREPPAPDWLRRLLGDEFLQEVTWANIAETTEGRNALDRALVHLRSLGRLRELILTAGCLQDTHLSRIQGLTALERLEIVGAVNLTDAGLAHLRGLDHLRSLAINDGALTDASLDHLAHITSLEKLDLRGNRLTDAGLGRLSRLPSLRRLPPGVRAQRDHRQWDGIAPRHSEP